MRAWVGSLVVASVLLFASSPASAAQVTSVQASDCETPDLFVHAVAPSLRALGTGISDIARLEFDPCGGSFGARPKESSAQIATWGGVGARVTTLPILLEGKDGAKATLAVYRVERASGGVSWVDHQGRWYSSWENWKSTNKLPEGKMTYPKNGNLVPGKGCVADPETSKTPASSFWSQARGYADKAAMVGGVALGVAAIVGTGGAIVPIAGAVMMAYGAYRSADALVDLGTHKQSLNPIKSAEARGAWIGLGSSVVGLGAMGATMRAGTILATQGAQAGASAANVAAHLQVASQLTNTVGIADLGYNVTKNWNHLSPKERAMALSQIVFWAGMTAHSANKSGGFRNLYDARAIRESMIRSYAPDAVVLPDPLMNDLKSAMKKLGLKADDPAEVRRLLSMESTIPDSAVEALRNEVLTNPKYAGEAGEVLRHYTADALKKGVDTPEGRMLRLEMLMLAVPEKTRPALMEAVRIDMSAHSDRIKGFLARTGEGLDATGQPVARVKRVIIGGGSQGATLANELNRIGQGDGTLVVDASRAGDNNFGTVRNFRLNSETGTYEGRVGGAKPGRTANPLHGGAIQVEDLLPPTPGNTFPDAGTFGDAQVLALHAARRTGTDVMTEARVTGVKDLGAGRTGGRYLITIEDVSAGRTGKSYQVFTDQVVDATGLGKPSVPMRDAGSQSYITDQSARLAKSGGAGLRTQGVVHGEDFLRTYTNASPAERASFLTNSEGNVIIIGGGDAAKTSAELIQRIAAERGTTVKQMLGGKKIEWIGIDPQKDLWTRYEGVRDLFDTGAASTLGGRVEKIEPIAGTNRSRITLKMPDGTFETRDAGRVVLAMGMRSDTPGVFKDVVPQGFDWKTGRVPVMGRDPVFGDASPLASRIPGQDVFLVGMASGLERAPDHSWLEYFGWKNLLVADQVLADGKPLTSPFAGLRGTAVRTVVQPSIGASSSAGLATPGAMTPLPSGDPKIAARVGLHSALSQFEFPGTQNLDLTFARENGALVVKAQNLDAAATRALATEIGRSQGTAGLLNTMAANGPVGMRAVVENGRVVIVSAP